jgi:hypothetical protein
MARMIPDAESGPLPEFTPVPGGSRSGAVGAVAAAEPCGVAPGRDDGVGAFQAGVKAHHVGGGVQGDVVGDRVHEAVIDELLKAPVPRLYMTLVQKAHAILCDASRDGVRLYYPGGDVEHVTPQVRADVHAAITTSLERDWPSYIQGLIDRGALQTQ